MKKYLLLTILASLAIPATAQSDATDVRQIRLNFRPRYVTTIVGTEIPATDQKPKMVNPLESMVVGDSQDSGNDKNESYQITDYYTLSFSKTADATHDPYFQYCTTGEYNLGLNDYVVLNPFNSITVQAPAGVTFTQLWLRLDNGSNYPIYYGSATTTHTFTNPYNKIMKVLSVFGTTGGEVSETEHQSFHIVDHWMQKNDNNWTYGDKENGCWKWVEEENYMGHLAGRYVEGLAADAQGREMWLGYDLDLTDEPNTIILRLDYSYVRDTEGETDPVPAANEAPIEYHNYAHVMIKEAGSDAVEVLQSTEENDNQENGLYAYRAEIGSYAGKKVRIGLKYIKDDDPNLIIKVNNMYVGHAHMEHNGVQSGVEESMVADDPAPLWYNLQGIKVENPGKGLFIEVKGGKSRKVLKK